MNLTAVLALAALVDLVVHRLTLRLFASPAWQASGVGALVGGVGLFAAHLVGLLGIALFVATMLRLLRRGELFPRGMRLAAVAFAGGFALLVLFAFGLSPLPSKFQVHLKTTFAFWAWMVAFAASRPPALWRAKLGVTLFAFPAIMHAAALFAARAGWGSEALGPAELARAGALGALAAAALAPFTLGGPLIGRAPRWSWILGLAAASLVAWALAFHFELASAVATYGLRFDLAPAGLSASRLLDCAFVVLATFGGVAFVAGALARQGPARLAAYGVVLLVVTGHQAGGPADLAASACGLLALAVAVGRAVEPIAEDGQQVVARPSSSVV